MILFSRAVKWEDVEKYLKQYVGEFYTIAETNDVIYIGSDLPDEYAHSAYTATLKGSNAKAKANAAQGLGEMLEIAVKGKFTHNTKENIKSMPQTDGTVMNHGLDCLYMMQMES